MTAETQVSRNDPPHRSQGPVLPPELVEEMYALWTADPLSVPESWQLFFQGYALGAEGQSQGEAEHLGRVAALRGLVEAYRGLGHLIAQTDPLGESRTYHPDLDVGRFGFTEADLDAFFDRGDLPGDGHATLDEILGILLDTYCRSVGVEYMHIQEPEVRAWLRERMEPTGNAPPVPREKKLEILAQLVDAHLFETFVHTHYPGQKRFSLEGGEALIPALHAVMERAPEVGVFEVVLGMSHRGRLNVLANILDKSYASIFSEFEANFLPASVWGSGDVKYHKGYSSDHVNRQGRSVHISLTANPSHLEAVNPVVEGKARAKQRQRGDTETRRTVLPLLVHGDAGFAGQGIVAETLNLSQLEGYRTGGTLHIVVNNQIGFTTASHEARSTTYATDVAKMIEAPIFHVNGDDPEAVVNVVELALDFRQRFARDVVVDLLCYRRHGHNEGDDPAFTQPLMVAAIRARSPILELYSQHLIRTGVITVEEADAIRDDLRERLQKAYRQVQEGATEDRISAYDRLWTDLDRPWSDAPVDTGVSPERLLRLAEALSRVPEGFHLSPKLARRFQSLLEAVRRGDRVDWGYAELLAFASLLGEGTPVRLSGQDSARGTFSHRHALWVDQETGSPYVPLNHLSSGQARFCVYNSLLSEAAVLGFEYGYSLAEPRMLNLWEAQFGDFSNGAQVIIDQFITSSESKWQRSSGLVMLLPHGHEGQGPEHSNAYLERYLQACAEDNIQVCSPTTPAQYFHLLRRQMKRPFRRPLVVMAPKSLLRHPRAQSPVEDLAAGSFAEVLSDSHGPEAPRRLLLCSGKIYYDLAAYREEHPEMGQGVMILRMEQLYPFPWRRLGALVEGTEMAEEVIWVQEEPENRGAFTFMAPRLGELFVGRPIRYVGRPRSASPATGSLRRHREEQAQIVRSAFEKTWRPAGE